MTATGCSGATFTTSACGNARSTDAPATDGRARIRSSSERASTSSRLRPSSARVTFRTSRTTAGGAPCTSMRSTPKTALERAPQYTSRTAATSANPIRRERPEGVSRARDRRSPTAPCGNGTTTLAACVRRRDSRPVRPPAMRRHSPPAPALLRHERGKMDCAGEDDLPLGQDSELLVRAPPRLDHEREAVGRGGVSRVLDEVRVHRRDARSTDPVPLEPAQLEHPPGARVPRGVLEDAPKSALVRRLCRLALRDQLGDVNLDLLGRPGREPVLDLRDYLSGPELGVTVRKAELFWRQGLGPVGGHDDCADEDVRPVAAVCARVHLHTAARSAGDRAGELEAPEPGCARTMEADRVGRATTRDDPGLRGFRGGELTLEPQHERIHSDVRGEQVRAEPDDDDVEPFVPGVAQR